MGDLSFPKSYHLRRPADFRSVFGQGLKRHTREFVMFRTPNSLGHLRLGLSVSRKVGKAVQRNRVRRIVREVVRLNWKRWDLGGCDIVVVAKKGAAGLSFHDINRDLTSAFSPRQARS